MIFAGVLIFISMMDLSLCVTLRIADQEAVMYSDRGKCLDLDIFGICDKDHPCPYGYKCRYISILPGTQACIRNGPSTSSTSAKRAGRCPATTTQSAIASAPLSDMRPPRPGPPGKGGRPPPPGKGRPPPPPPPPSKSKILCNDHLDCPTNKRCCPTSFADVSYCVDAEPVNSAPTVTTIIEGVQRFELDPVQMHSGCVLIQSNGFNVLVDVSVHRIVILDNMLNLTGLLVQDIDMVVETHGHPEHYSGAQSFQNVDHVFNTVTYNGNYFKLNPLNKKEKYFLNNDNNIEVIQTPGHTPQDVSVIVRNVPNLGTVAIVGDLIGEKDEAFDQNAWNRSVSDENRKKVVCMSDYVIPGHGPMFEVDDEQKSKYKC